MAKIKKKNKGDTIDLMALCNKNLLVVIIFCILSVLFVDYGRVNVGTRIKKKDFVNPQYYGPLVEFLTKRKTSADVLLPYLTYYQEYQRHAESSPDVLNMLGFCYFYGNHYQKAAEHYEILLRKHPEYFWSYYNLALLYMKADKYKEVIALLESATVLKPDYTLELTMKSRAIYRPIIARMNLQYPDLRNRLKKAYEESYIMLVISNYKLGDYEKMFKSADFARRAKVGREDLFLYYLGVASYELKDYPQAVAFFQESLRLNKNSGDVYYYLSLSLEALKMTEQAATAMAQSKNLGLNNILEIESFRLGVKPF